MSPWILWLVFVIAEATLIFYCVSTKAPAIEAELSLKSLEALRSRNLDLGEGFVMDGRDAWLTGPAVSDAEKARAGLAVAEVPGVRMVHNLLKAGGDVEIAQTRPATPEPAPSEPPAPEPPAPEPPAPRAATPEPAPAPPPRVPADAPNDLQRSIDDLVAGRAVEFESGSDRLTSRGAALVDEVAALLARYPDARVSIAGHTDSQGTSRNNLEVSRQRARAVRSRLVAAGVRESRLSAEGYGEDRPIADNSTAAGRLRNRRVEFKVE